VRGVSDALAAREGLATHLDRKKSEKEDETLGAPSRAVDGRGEDIASRVLILASDEESDDDGEAARG